MTLPLLSNQKRYIVHYECEDNGRVRTYSVWAVSASVAIAKTTQYIEDENHHRSDEPYFLIPRINRLRKADYDIF